MGSGGGGPGSTTGRTSSGAADAVAGGPAGFLTAGVRGVVGFLAAGVRAVAGFFVPAALCVADFEAAGVRGVAGFLAAGVRGVAGFFAAGVRGLRGAAPVEALRADEVRGVGFFTSGVSAGAAASASPVGRGVDDAVRRGARGRGGAAGEVSTLAASSSDPAEADSGGCGSDAVIAPNYQPPRTPTPPGDMQRSRR